MLFGCVLAEAINEKLEPEVTSAFSAGEKSVNLGFAHQCSHIPAYPGTNRAMSAHIRSNKDIPVIIAF